MMASIETKYFNIVFAGDTIKELIKMIPKIIHYCWFGKAEIPEEVKKYISTWHKFCPDYKYMLWSEDNFDVNISDFTKEAYQNKKYAFVSDYVRFYALERFGGIYLDVDMELLKSLDRFLGNDFFLGYEEDRKDTLVATCIIGSIQGHEFNRKMLDIYNNMKFIDNLGNMNVIPNTQYVTKLLRDEYGVHGDKECIENTVHVYPWDFFHPLSLRTGKLNQTENTVAIHRHTLLWVSPITRIIKWLRVNILIPLIGVSTYTKFAETLKVKKIFR